MNPPGPDDRDGEPTALGGAGDSAGERAAQTGLGVPRGPADAKSTSADALVELNALLGRGTRYEGKLYFEGRMRIEGIFTGEIRGSDVLVIGEGAEIEANIEVGVCIVTGGTVRGSLRARDAIELHAPGVVLGDLHAPNVFIDRGAQFEGSCKMAPLDATPTPPPAAPQPDPPPAAPEPTAFMEPEPLEPDEP